MTQPLEHEPTPEPETSEFRLLTAIAERAVEEGQNAEYPGALSADLHALDKTGEPVDLKVSLIPAQYSLDGEVALAERWTGGAARTQPHEEFVVFNEGAEVALVRLMVDRSEIPQTDTSDTDDIIEGAYKILAAQHKWQATKREATRTEGTGIVPPEVTEELIRQIRTGTPAT